MKTQSAKAKGRRLQQWVRDKIIETFPWLTLDDVRSTSMGAGGADIQLSSAAQICFPFDVECKSQEIYKTIYGYMEQAESHGKNTPIVVLKMNNKSPLVVLHADEFLTLAHDSYLFCEKG